MPRATCPVCNEPLPAADRDRRVSRGGHVVCGRATCEERADDVLCSGPSCSRPVVAHGLCASHYAQHRRGRPLSPLGPRVGERGEGERLTIRVSPPTLKRLRQEGPPATVARRWLEERAKR
jgi:hypothetical protein